jgi:hypothetical protein
MPCLPRPPIMCKSWFAELTTSWATCSSFLIRRMDCALSVSFQQAPIKRYFTILSGPKLAETHQRLPTSGNLSGRVLFQSFAQHGCMRTAVPSLTIFMNRTRSSRHLYSDRVWTHCFKFERSPLLFTRIQSTQSIFIICSLKLRRELHITRRRNHMNRTRKLLTFSLLVVTGRCWFTTKEAEEAVEYVYQNLRVITSNNDTNSLHRIFGPLACLKISKRSSPWRHYTTWALDFMPAFLTQNPFSRRTDISKSCLPFASFVWDLTVRHIILLNGTPMLLLLPVRLRCRRSVISISRWLSWGWCLQKK